MSGLVNCATHGAAERTRVCEHVVASLLDHQPRGFWWVLDGGQYQALCTACENMSENEWVRACDSLEQPLCLGCYLNAAELNGVSIPQVH